MTTRAIIMMVALSSVGAGLPGGHERNRPAKTYQLPESIRSARMVTYLQRVVIGGDADSADGSVARVMIAEPGLIRTELPTGAIINRNLSNGVELRLNPTTKTATIVRHAAAGALDEPGVVGLIDWLKLLANGAGRLVGSEELDDGQLAEKWLVELNRSPDDAFYQQVTVWTMEENGVPIAAERVDVLNPDYQTAFPVVELSIDDFGGGLPEETHLVSPFGIDGRAESVVTVLSGFEWHEHVDEGAFSSSPPDDYALVEMQPAPPGKAEQEAIGATLMWWAEHSGGELPARVADLADANRLRGLLVRGTRRDVTPNCALAEAVQRAGQVLRTYMLIRELTNERAFRYTGEGVRLGQADAKQRVCAWQDPDGGYRVLYADLSAGHVDDIDPGEEQ